MNRYGPNIAVLVNRNGKEEFRLPMIPAKQYSSAWIWHADRWWGFGVGKLNGEHHFYEVLPLDNPPMGQLGYKGGPIT